MLQTSEVEQGLFMWYLKNYYIKITEMCAIYSLQTLKINFQVIFSSDVHVHGFIVVLFILFVLFIYFFWGGGGQILDQYFTFFPFFPHLLSLYETNEKQKSKWLKKVL